jgi:dihydroorotase
VDPAVDIFDREQRFIETVLVPVTHRFPNLRIVFEHITTSDAVQFVRAHRPRVAATITPQHILLNRNALFEGGLRPHHYCLPVLKAERHRKMVLAAATSGESGFFLGTDSAPHARGAKESACGCAGVFSAHAGIELYAEAFDACGRLDRLEAFASRNGPEFYRLPANTGSLTLVRQPWTVPASYPLGDAEVVPFRAGAGIDWRISASGNADG